MIGKTHIGYLAAALAVPLAAAAIAGCGGGDNGTASTARPAAADGHPATVGVATEGNLGRVLVDTRGRTLYLFEKDAGTHSTCTGACAAEWPPLRAAGKPVAGAGLSAAKIGTITRSDGRPEVTYNGHPLYLFTGDRKPGDTNGQGISAFGAKWFALSAAGNRVAAAESTSGGGYGY